MPSTYNFKFTETCTHTGVDNLSHSYLNATICSLDLFKLDKKIVPVKMSSFIFLFLFVFVLSSLLMLSCSIYIHHIYLTCSHSFYNDNVSYIVSYISRCENLQNVHHVLVSQFNFYFLYKLSVAPHLTTRHVLYIHVDGEMLWLLTHCNLQYVWFQKLQILSELKEKMLFFNV